MSDLGREPPGVRREMAELWAFRALAEQSAGRRLLRAAAGLARLGADPALVQGARRAVDDEFRHARLCAEAASLFDQARVPPLFAAEIVGPAGDTDERALYDVVSACCVSETLNVRVMAASLVGTRDGAMRALQKEILRDEVEHSGVGWRFVEASGRDLAFLGPSLAGMLGLPSRNKLFAPPPAPPPDEERLRRLGWLPRSALRALFCETLAEQIFPRLERLGVDTAPARAALSLSLG